MDELIGLLRQALANNFILYLKSHQYHVNITGPDFPEYHEFLNKFYEQHQGLIDSYAEVIRQLGAYPDLDLQSLGAQSVLQSQPEQFHDYETMFSNLLIDSDRAIQTIQAAYVSAGAQAEYGIQNFLADRQTELRQTSWQIQAILGGD